MRQLLFFGLLLAFTACTDQKNPIGDSLFPKMKTVDSLQILYYDKENEDRFFIYLVNSDPSEIGVLINDLRFDTLAPVPCSRQGKIYCFVEGSIYNTVYFNLDCQVSHFRTIKNAKLYHFPMSDASRYQLLEWKKQAVSP